MMRHTEHLRAQPWEPKFVWTMADFDAAHQINVWHEDYPDRVERTIAALRNLEESLPAPGVSHSPTASASSKRLLAIHSTIFGDMPFEGRWREVNVSVGPHRAPEWSAVPALMDDLEGWFRVPQVSDWTVKTLTDWYHDLETIHPFQDGNGRVGGVFVAAVSHWLKPERGWLSPCQ